MFANKKRILQNNVDEDEPFRGPKIKLKEEQINKFKFTYSAVTNQQKKSLHTKFYKNILD